MKQVVHDEYRRGAESHWWFRARRRIFETFLEARGPLRDGARILDVGPGSGVNLPVLRARGHVTVVDLSRASLRDCHRRGARGLVEADGSRLPLADGSQDLVCALDVLEHMADERAALSEWQRVLRPGGHLLLSVPALPILWGRQDVLSGHHRRYRRRRLAALLRDAGFEVEHVTYFNTLLLPPILAVRLLMRPFLGRTVRRGGSDLGMPALGLDPILFRLFAAEAPWLRHRSLPLGVSLLAWGRRAPGR